MDKFYLLIEGSSHTFYGILLVLGMFNGTQHTYKNMCECVTKRSKRLFNNAWKILVGHKREKTRIWCLKGYFKKYHLLLHPSSILPMKYISISFYILPLWNYFGMEWILIVLNNNGTAVNNKTIFLFYTIPYYVHILEW